MTDTCLVLRSSPVLFLLTWVPLFQVECPFVHSFMDLEYWTHSSRFFQNSNIYRLLCITTHFIIRMDKICRSDQTRTNRIRKKILGENGSSCEHCGLKEWVGSDSSGWNRIWNSNPWKSITDQAQLFHIIFENFFIHPICYLHTKRKY